MLKRKQFAFLCKANTVISYMIKTCFMKNNLLRSSFFLLAVVVLASIFAFANPAKKITANKSDEKGIQFIEQDWNKALKQAKDEKKLLFIDIYATWCGPCKMLKKNTFSDESVGAFFNSNFVNISVDGEKTVGPELARKFSLEGYPTLIVADADGNPLLYTVGYISAEQLMNFAKEALKKKS